MRQAEASFGTQELVLLYIAKRLREARKLEDLLTAAGLDYLVEADLYMGGFLFRRELHGAFFYVTDADTARSRAVLREAGYKPYEPDKLD